MNKIKLKQTQEKLWLLEFVLMGIPAYLLVFKIDIFNGFSILTFNLPFSNETLMLIFIAYELIMSAVTAISITYFISVVINLLKR